MEREFFIAKTVTEATLLKNEQCAYLAGGTEINRLNSGYAEKSLISLKKLNLDFIEQKDGLLKIGSMVTFQQLIDSNSIPNYLKKSCFYMASRTKRNMATIGGNLALRRFDSYLVPSLVVAGAKLVVQNKCDERKEVELINFIENSSDYEGSLILFVVLPNKNISVVSKRCSNTVLSHAFVTVALSYNGKKFGLYAGLKNSGFVSLNILAAGLNKKTKVTCEEICDVVKATNEIKFYDDIYGSIDYKKYILGVSIYELYCELKGESHED